MTYPMTARDCIIMAYLADDAIKHVAYREFPSTGVVRLTLEVRTGWKFWRRDKRKREAITAVREYLRLRMPINIELQVHAR